MDCGVWSGLPATWRRRHRASINLPRLAIGATLSVGLWEVHHTAPSLLGKSTREGLDSPEKLGGASPIRSGRCETTSETHL